MARRKQQLKHRVAAVGGTGGHPPVPSGATPMVMPLSQVVVSGAEGDQYVMLGSMEFDPLWATDGAMYPTVQPGTWGQLHAAGQP
jgi:hypothetical protein